MVINAVGPSFKINDKIALHALRNNCHYIDIGGYGILRDLLKPYEKSIEAQKLCFIIGVGWMPGISGVFSKTIIETHLNSPENTNLISIMVLLIIGHIVQLMIWQHHLWENTFLCLFSWKGNTGVSFSIYTSQIFSFHWT